MFSFVALYLLAQAQRFFELVFDFGQSTPHPAALHIIVNLHNQNTDRSV
jgi:hypothetical protein